MKHRTLDELNTFLEDIRKSPADAGELKMIVRRPRTDEREIMTEAEVTINAGLVGDIWPTKPSSSMPNGEPHPLKQITIMNSRAIETIAGSLDRWALAGDQFFVDMNLGYGNLPPGTRLALGTCLFEVSEPPHRGCKKFAERFGQDAMRFVNSEAGRELNLRGINCSVVKSGVVKTGDLLQKIQ